MKEPRCYERSQHSTWAPVDCCSSQLEPPPEFHIGIVYDGVANGAQAMHVCRRIIDRFNRDFLFRVTLCLLPSFTGDRTAAHRQAGRSSLILLATSALPSPAFWMWLDEWACAQRPHSAAIGGLISGDAMQMHAQLRGFCTSRDIELISAEEFTTGVGLIRATQG